MELVVTPLHPFFAARITGVDLSEPIDEGIQRAIERAMDTYAVCLLPDQRLEVEQQIVFSRFYGPLELSPGIGRKSEAIPPDARIQHREIFDISNLDRSGGILDENDARALFMRGNQLWHTDSSFKKEAATWSMLHAKAIPPAGGAQQRRDKHAAFEGPPGARKKARGRVIPWRYLWVSARQL